MRRGHARLATVVAIGSAAWLGCNALLGIERAEFAGEDAATLADAAGSDATPTDGSSTKDADPCVDLETNPNHCGACGRSCLGGACTGGRCGPVVVSAENGSPLAVTTDGAFVYWTNPGLGDVRRARTDGGPVEVVFDGPPGTTFGEGLQTYGGDVYFSVADADADGGVFRCPASGCGAGAPTAVATQLSAPAHMRVVDAGAGNARLLVAEGIFDGRIVSISLSGAAFTAAAVVATAEGFPSYVTGLDDDVYWDALLPGPGNLRASLASGAPATLRAATVAREIQVTANEVFYAELGQGVQAMARDGGAWRRVSPSAQVQRLAVDDAYVYFNDSTGAGPGRVLRCPRAGCEDAGVEVVAGSQLVPMALATDDVQLYWTNRGESGAGGGVMRLVK